MKVRIFALIILTLLLSTRAAAQNQSASPKRDLNIAAVSSAVETFSAWKSQVEEVALDIKKRSLSPFLSIEGLRENKPEISRYMALGSGLVNNSTLQGVKWLYDDTRASVNGLIDRMIFDLENRALPKAGDPYRNSILNAESKVNSFLSHTRNIVIRASKEQARVDRPPSQFTFERPPASGEIVEVGWPAVVAAVSFLAAAIELTSAVVKQYSELPKNVQNPDELQIIVSQLRSLQLRSFDKL